jgi:hypothetical protein
MRPARGRIPGPCIVLFLNLLGVKEKDSFKEKETEKHHCVL